MNALFLPVLALLILFSYTVSRVGNDKPFRKCIKGKLYLDIAGSRKSYMRMETNCKVLKDGTMLTWKDKI